MSTLIYFIWEQIKSKKYIFY